jgi:hypothetical protein
VSGVSIRLIRRLLAQRRCSVGLAWRQRLVLLSGVSLTGGYRAVGQRDRLARERCLSERVTSPQVVGPAQVFAGFRVPFCRPSVVRVGSAVGHRVNDLPLVGLDLVMQVVSTVGFGLCFVFSLRCAPHRRELVSGCTPHERARIWLQEPHSVEVSLVSFLLGLPSTV